MRKNAGSILKKILMLMCIAVLTGILTPGIPTQAMSSRKRALKAYEQMLSAKTMTGYSGWGTIDTENVSFVVIDVDGDKVPELLVAGDGYYAAGVGALYTWKAGKVVTVGVFPEAFGYYKKKGIFVESHMVRTAGGVESISYHRLKKGKSSLFLTAYKKGNSMKYYNSRGRQISRTKFKKQLKKTVGSSKCRSVKLYRNTEKNRRKYLSK